MALCTQVLLDSIERIRSLPKRSDIRSTRLRATGYFAQWKKALFARCPWRFELEDWCKKLNRRVLKPVAIRLGLYSILCECVPLIRIFRFLQQLWDRLLKFRWLCDWCPPFILRLRRDVSVEEEEAAFEKEQRDQQQQREQQEERQLESEDERQESAV